MQIICAQESEGGLYDVRVKYAMDGAGCHQDKRFLTYLENDFKERGWMFRFQPSQSPITNVHDAAIFPSLSKRVSNEQGMTNRSYILRGEQLWETVKESWNKMPLSTIARAYAGHHQIVNAIINNKGGTIFYTQKAAYILASANISLSLKMDVGWSLFQLGMM